MTAHATGTREQWRAARLELLEQEKDLTRRSDELARRRQELPWVRLDKEYVFGTEDGEKTLAELFAGRSQLLVYHFMFGPGWDAGCPSCSSFADQIDGWKTHLAARDVTLMCISRAPIEKLLAYRERMGWHFPWASSYGSDFNYDFGVSFTDEQVANGAEYNFRQETDSVLYEELPGLSAFALEGGAVYHTYSQYARGGDVNWGMYQLLDRAPLGRNEGSPPEDWIRRHDEYEGVTAGTTT